MIARGLEFSLRQLALVLLATALLVGCGHKEAAEHSEAEAAATGISYSPKNGLLVSSETAKFIGLETVEVSEQPIAATKEIAARVFRAATTSEPRALASALLSAADAAVLRPGLTATTTLASLSAEVIRLDHSSEAQTGIMEAILRIADAQAALSEGSFVTIRVEVGSTNSVMAVPSAALLRTIERDFVYILNGEHFIRAAVKLGRTNGEFVEVVDGLLTGDKVVVQPVMTLWMTELHNVNGGDACCISAPKK